MDLSELVFLDLVKWAVLSIYYPVTYLLMVDHELPDIRQDFSELILAWTDVELVYANFSEHFLIVPACEREVITWVSIIVNRLPNVWAYILEGHIWRSTLFAFFARKWRLEIPLPSEVEDRIQLSDNTIELFEAETVSRLLLVQAFVNNM